jgi:hypothetical protein
METFPLSDKEEIELIAAQFLQKNEIKFTSIGKPRFEIITDGEKEIKKNFWTVSYEYKVFETELAFIYIDDESKEVLFILTKHDRICVHPKFKDGKI